MRYVSIAILAFFIVVLTMGRGFAGEDNFFILQVRDHLNGHTYFQLPVQVGSLIKLQILHSYDRLPFWELYEVRRDNRFVLKKIGGSSLLNGQGFIYSNYRNLPDGTWEITDINEILSVICFFMGTKGDGDHRIITPTTTVNLSDVVEPGRIVRLSLTSGKE